MISKRSAILLWVSVLVFILVGCSTQVSATKPPPSYVNTIEESAILDLRAPVLLSPGDNSKLGSGRNDGGPGMIWDFDWSDVKGATEYWIFAYSGGLAWPLIDRKTASSSFHYESTGYLPAGKVFWHVRARVGGAWSVPSPVSTFDFDPSD